MTYQVTISCPECKRVQQAEVIEGCPFSTYLHDCEQCGYIIMESDWNEV